MGKSDKNDLDWLEDQLPPCNPLKMAEFIHVDNLEEWHKLICTHLMHGECTQFGSDFNVEFSAKRPSEIQFLRVRCASHKFEWTEKHMGFESARFCHSSPDQRTCDPGPR